MSADWKADIVSQLICRNDKETHYFQDLFKHYIRALEIANSLRTKYAELTNEVELLRRDNLRLSLRADAPGGVNSEARGDYEQKIYKLQEELSDLLRSRSQNAQQNIDLRNSLEQKEKLLAERDSKISVLENEVELQKKARQQLESEMLKLRDSYKMMVDEHASLRLTVESLSDKIRVKEEEKHAADAESAKVLQELMVLKGALADRANADNDQFISKKRNSQTHASKELEAAIKTFPKLPETREDLMPAMAACGSSSLPNRSLKNFECHEGETNTVRWSPSGKLLATGGSDRKLKLWTLYQGRVELKATLTGASAALLDVSFDPTESIVVGASGDYAIRIWGIADLRLRQTLTGHSAKVYAAKCLDDSKLVSGSHDRSIKLWDLREKACIKTFMPGSSCHDLAACQDLGPALIVSGHFDKKLRIWDTRSNSDGAQREIDLPDRITSVTMNPDHQSVLTCSRDDTLRIVDLRQCRIVQLMSAPGFKVASDYSRATIAPDGVFAAAGSMDGSLFVWNAANGRAERCLSKEHSAAVLAVDWHPRGSELVSVDRGRHAVLWTDI